MAVNRWVWHVRLVLSKTACLSQHTSQFTAAGLQAVSVDAAHTTITLNKTLEHKAENATVPVPYYFTFPEEFASNSSHSHQRQPLVFLMNGFSVEASRYTGVIAGLAARGFVVVSSDYYHDWTSPPFPPFPRANFMLLDYNKTPCVSFEGCPLSGQHRCSSHNLSLKK